VLWKASARVAGPFCDMQGRRGQFLTSASMVAEGAKDMERKKDYQVDLVDAAQVGVVAYKCVRRWSVKLPAKSGHVGARVDSALWELSTFQTRLSSSCVLSVWTRSVWKEVVRECA